MYSIYDKLYVFIRYYTFVDVNENLVLLLGMAYEVIPATRGLLAIRRKDVAPIPRLALWTITKPHGYEEMQDILSTGDYVSTPKISSLFTIFVW